MNGPLLNWACTIHFTRTIDWSIVKLDLYHPSYQDNWLIHCQIGLVSILSGQLTDPLSNWTCTIHLTTAIDWSIVKLDLYHLSYQENCLVHCQIGIVPSTFHDNWLLHCQIGIVPSILSGQLTDPLSNWTCAIHLIRAIGCFILKLDLHHPSYQDNWLIHCQIGIAPSILPGQFTAIEIGLVPSILSGQLTASLSNWTCTIHLIHWDNSYQDLIHCQIGLVPSILLGQLTDPLSNWNCTIYLTRTIDWSIVKLACTIHFTRTIEWTIVKLGLHHPFYQDNWLIHCQIGLVPSILQGQLTDPLSNWTCTIHLTRQFTDPLSNWTCTIHLIRTIDWSIFKLDLYHPSYKDNWLIHCQIGLVPSILPGQLTDPLSNWTCTIHLIRTIDWSIVKLELYHPSYQDNWLLHCQIGLAPSILPGQLTDPLSNWTCTIHLTRTIDWSIVKLGLLGLYHPSYQDNWLIHCQIGLVPSILSGQLTASLSNWTCTIHLTRKIDWSIVKLELYHLSSQDNPDPLLNWACTIHFTRTIEWTIVKLGLHHPFYQDNWLIHCQIGLVPSILPRTIYWYIVKLDLYHPSYQDNWLLHFQIGLVPSILQGQLTDPLSNWTCTIHLTTAIDWSIVKLDLYHPSYQDNWLIHCQIGIVPSILSGQLTASLSNWTCTIHLTRAIDWSIVKLDLYHPSYQDNWLIHCQIGLVGLVPSILSGQLTDPLSNWTCTIHLTRTIDCSIVKLDLYHPSY